MVSTKIGKGFGGSGANGGHELQLEINWPLVPPKKLWSIHKYGKGLSLMNTTHLVGLMVAACLPEMICLFTIVFFQECLRLSL
jgi:hypothetical protein